MWIDFNQGLDARLIDDSVARLLSRLHWIRYVRVSCDTPAMIPVVERAAERLVRAGVARSRLWSYVLVQDIPAALETVTALRRMGVEPFAQPYRDFDGGEPTKEQKAFARWCNNKPIFKSCSWDDYRRK